MSHLELTSCTIGLGLALLLYYILTTVLGPRYPKPLPPGPKPWPIIGNLNCIRKAPHQDFTVLARKYGPLLYLRLGSVDLVVASSATVAAQFLKAHDLNFASRPPTTGTKYLVYDFEDLAFAPYGPRWRMLRKMCSLHLLSAKVVDDFKIVRRGEVYMLLKALSDARKKPVQLGQLINVCITNTLTRMMLGKRVFNYDAGKNDQKADEFKDMVVEFFVLAGAFNISDYLPAIGFLDLQGVTARMKKLHNKLDNFIGAILEEQKAKKGAPDNSVASGDLMTTLISLQDDCDGQGTKLTDTEIKTVLTDLFTAGTDTSSSTIEWAIAELIRHPKVLAKVQQELDSVVGRDRLVNELDLAQLTYLQAVIKEVFRIHPAAPLSVPRMAIDSCEINGYYIPKGTTLLVNMWAIGRDPDLWASPLEFRPERFLPGGERPNADVKGNDFELIPFGSGRRVCVGMNLGLRMVQFVTATLAHSFDLELADGQMPENLNMEEAYGLTLQRKVPLVVHPRTRLLAHAYDMAH